MKNRFSPSFTLNIQAQTSLKQQHVNFNNFATSWRADSKNVACLEDSFISLSPLQMENSRLNCDLRKSKLYVNNRKLHAMQLKTTKHVFRTSADSHEELLLRWLCELFCSKEFCFCFYMVFSFTR
jgi:hypothetical protein